METYHVPVMLHEVLEHLALKPNGVYVDGTFGGGGHTSGILEAEPSAKVFAFDRDGDAITCGRDVSGKFPGRLFLFRENFRFFRTQLAMERIRKIDGMLLDLGISSHFVDTPERGYNMTLEGRLDMRMNQDEDVITAAELVNEYPESEIRRIIYDYGEEREAGRIAEGIVVERARKPIQTTVELGEIIDRWTRSPHKLKAKARVFQAIRIYINGELEALREALVDATALLNPGGRLAVISFQSLEDRIVKQLFQRYERGCVCPPEFPACVCGRKPSLTVVTRKPLTPSPVEITANRRARSARLRIAEKKGAQG
jgi:16S rRNA (cytosine1402-N4)-methyltransferase